MIRRRPSPRRSRRHASGFTILEILIVATIVGFLGAMMIPNLLMSIQRAKQKATMANIHEVGKALSSWHLDQVAAAAAGQIAFPIEDYGSPIDIGELAEMLVPLYLDHVPERDGWGNDFEYRLLLEALNSPRVMAIRSPGRDGEFDDDYDYGSFASTNFDGDLVWADGIFVSWPQDPSGQR